MKGRILALLVCAAIATGAIICNEKNAEADCIRIHIRAASNSQYDQSIKLALRDEVVAHLTPILSSAQNKKQAKALLKKELHNLTKLSNECLAQNNIEYTANCYLSKEEFPARKYGELIFESGEYDALIISLGEGKGDNWWCVAYPPLCFVPEGDGEVIYKSKILEIIESYKEKHGL